MINLPSKQMRNRILIILIIFIIPSFLFVCFNLAKVQLINGEYYKQKAINQQQQDTIISPKRGIIYDRNMTPLAQSATAWTIYISPAGIPKDADKEFLADKLSEILEVDRETILKKANQKTMFEVIRRRVEEDMANKVRQLIIDHKMTYISIAEDSKRYYPYNDFAASVLGFVGVDRGLSGIESYYEAYLKGVPGKIVSAKNAWGKDMPFDYERMINAKNGNHVVLTIDQIIQHFVEKNLSLAVKENQVTNRGAVIVMDVNTGEILAAANKPDFDPNRPFEILDPAAKGRLVGLTGEELEKQTDLEISNQWRNKIVSDVYEPGSIFKIITAAAALEEGVVKLDDRFNCTGSLQVANRRIGCWKHAGHGSQTFEQGVMNSCNPVFMNVGARLGANNFYKYFEAFGFTKKTNIDFPGEAIGIWHTASGLKPVELAVSSFGQTFKITPLQMITAVSAVVNGGKLVTPRIVKQIIDDDGRIVEKYEPEIKRQVISKETSVAMCSVLEKVVSQGTGKNAYILGYRIGGKTGTSEKIDQKNDQGVVDKYISSFLAVAPMDNPKIAVLVLLDEPNPKSSFGGVIAAPVAGKILADILPYLNVEPKYTEEEYAKLDTITPSLINKTIEASEKLLSSKGLKSRVEGSGSTVIKQSPPPNQAIPKGATVVLYTDNSKEKTVVVPNFAGLTMAQVNKTAANSNINIKFIGTDLQASNVSAYAQSVPPGTKIPLGSIVEVEFRHLDEVE